ncbi:hypothetical protein CERSUDRAFT_120336, partial [Gelatoporia subvermispora B]
MRCASLRAVGHTVRMRFLPSFAREYARSESVAPRTCIQDESTADDVPESMGTAAYAPAPQHVLRVPVDLDTGGGLRGVQRCCHNV